MDNRRRLEGILYARGELYITTGNFNFIRPKGSLLNIGITKPDTVLTNAKIGNGLFYDEKSNALYYGEVLSGISRYDLSSKTVTKTVGKSSIVEGFDDFCIDKDNNIWIADPPSNFIKCWVPKTNTVYHIKIIEFGIASSCRIKEKNGQEYVYITEIKRENSKEYDGRGVLIVPTSEILKKLVDL